MMERYDMCTNAKMNSMSFKSIAKKDLKIANHKKLQLQFQVTIDNEQ